MRLLKMRNVDDRDEIDEYQISEQEYEVVMQALQGKMIAFEISRLGKTFSAYDFKGAEKIPDLKKVYVEKRGGFFPAKRTGENTVEYYGSWNGDAPSLGLMEFPDEKWFAMGTQEEEINKFYESKKAERLAGPFEEGRASLPKKQLE